MNSQDKGFKKYFIYCDGGARGNPGPAATGFAIKDESGKLIYKQSKTIGHATNNIAEYKAIIQALSWLKDYLDTIPKVSVSADIFLDSKLVTSQLNGDFKIKNQSLQKQAIKIRELEEIMGFIVKSIKGETANQSLFSKNQNIISYNLIPREKNSLADSLVNQALDNQNS